ncbi:MAG: hypothetical protein Q4B99_01855 [Clostridia bacterium]|nr:hypothetical protein [Clostridia bacterium]
MDNNALGKRRAFFEGKSTASLLVFCVLEAFALYSAVSCALTGTAQQVALSLVSVLLFALTYSVEWLFRLQMSSAMEIMCMVFCIGPLAGSVYKLYFVFEPFDKLLHTFSGFLGAAIGFGVPDLLDSENRSHSRLLKCVSAFCVAMTFAGLWEFLEYAGDRLLGTDMQNDTIVTEFSSYLLGGDLNTPPTISGIDEVVINGELVLTGGYIDIGIIDTMRDMLVCAVGSLAFVATAALGGEERVRPFVPVRAA